MTPAHRHPTLETKLVDVVYGSLYLFTKVLFLPPSYCQAPLVRGRPINTHFGTVRVSTIGQMPVAAFTSRRVTIHDGDDEVSLEVLYLGLALHAWRM